MTDNLADLLLDHPFGDDRDLLCTIDGTVTAGRAREMARDDRDASAGGGARNPVTASRSACPRDPSWSPPWWASGSPAVSSSRSTTAPPEAEVQHVIETIRPARDPRCRRPAQPARIAARHDDAVAFVTWTSGTTGPPKAILQSHGGYLELLDRVLAPLRGQGAAKATDREPTPNLVPVSRRAERRDLQRVLRAPGRCRGGAHAPVLHGGLRRAGPPLPGAVHRVAAGRHGHADRRPGR